MKDPFAPPNSRQVNVGNQITIYGAKGDAYAGNMENNTVPCGSLTNIEELDQTSVQLNIFPNPVTETLNLSMNWNKKSEPIILSIIDLAGKAVYNKSIQLNKGFNQEKVAINQLAQGSYFIELRGADWKVSSQQFVKVN